MGVKKEISPFLSCLSPKKKEKKGNGVIAYPYQNALAIAPICQEIIIDKYGGFDRP